MDSDAVMKLAREARLPTCHATHPVALSRFAALVIAQERKRCTSICREMQHEMMGKREQGCAFGVAGMALTIAGNRIEYPEDK